MKTNDPSFKAGYSARMSDLPLDANPFLFEAAPRAMWALGWNYGELKTNLEIYNAEPLERVDAKPYEQGQIAFKRGVEASDCPYGRGDAHGDADEQETFKARSLWLDGHWQAKCFAANHASPQPELYGEAKTINKKIIGKGPYDNFFDAANYQRYGRGYRDNAPRMVPLIDQNGKQVGLSRLDITKVECHVDEAGTCWNPPTGWAYMAICLALRMAQAKAALHAKRVSDLLEANNIDVERRRAAERELAEYKSVHLDDGK